MPKAYWIVRVSVRQPERYPDYLAAARPAFEKFGAKFIVRGGPFELMEGQVWGQGFAAPVFCDEFKVVSQRILKEKHLKLLLERNGNRYDAIWFGHTDALGSRARVAFRLDANEYNGVTKVQLMVEHAEAI